ncbi:MAG TPA: class I SAM-dependent methyltransferase [Microthrixaceae bacterium]|nr:class I SAM-dependent methyltransferase [Microthrixaceae bacterium]HMT23735.1 class I SAM-dependent methyltransferase [Microthrixaceae bacterium]HMT61571.1 class I SAM-dependent methyltransferase [Microthrixaceae bacterium]
MFIPRELLQNLAMGVGPIRRAAQTRHRTGVQQDPQRGKELFDALIAMTGELGASSVLELGPGRGRGLMDAAIGHVGSYAAFDVEPYMDARELARSGIDYRIDASGRLPWDVGTFDVVWSHSVFEHLRDPGATLDEIHRVLKPGGLHIADIDLQDHYGDRTDPESMFGFLRYSERLWRAMTSHRSSYCNRLRISDWRSEFDVHGFESVAESRREVGVSERELRAIPYLAHLTTEDLLTAGATMVSRRREQAARPGS